MGLTLEQLEKYLPEILQKGLVNTFFRGGYPILHLAAMGLRDERDRTKRPRYLALIEKILQYPGCNPNVLDKHRKTSLMYAAEEGSLPLLSLLLKYKANPDLIDERGKMTALEWGIYRNPTSPVINRLDQCTKRTDKMLENSRELFDRAVEEEDVNWINVLLDLRLVDYQKPRAGIASSLEIPKAFWMRTISDPQNEKNILDKREKWSDGALDRLRHKQNTGADPYYTPYSPCTFVRQEIPISLFSNLNETALMIHPSSSPIAFWYDGHREELTREMLFYEGSHLSHGEHQTGQHREITPAGIQSEVERLYRKEVRKCRRHKHENPEQYDKHDLLLDRSLSSIHFAWNEGLLRYKHRQVFGIHIDPDNKESVIQGLQLRQTLKLDVSFYHYNSESGVTQRLDTNALLRKWGLRVPRHDGRKSYLGNQTDYAILSSFIFSNPGTTLNTELLAAAVKSYSPCKLMCCQLITELSFMVLSNNSLSFSSR